MPTKLLLILGSIPVAVSFTLLAAFHEHVWQIILATSIGGIGFGIGLSAVVVHAVPAEHTGAARTIIRHPHSRRIVLEVDGMQHFTRNRRTEPDSSKYAATMAGDRDLKFQGYEVFRFGHDELRHRPRAQPLLSDFFRKLLNRPARGEQREEDAEPGAR
jgi:hypothetical protein